MEKTHSKKRIILPYIILAIVIVSVTLILAELWSNVSRHIQSTQDSSATNTLAGFYQLIAPTSTLNFIGLKVTPSDLQPTCPVITAKTPEVIDA